MKKAVLHAVWNAQGKGCSPGAVGVCIGGDRTSGYTHAKEQLFRTLDDVNPDQRLAELEASIMAAVNTLEIGTMGFGGRVTLIGCKIGALNRLPASFLYRWRTTAGRFADWASSSTRAPGRLIAGFTAIRLTRSCPMLDQAGFVRTGREIALRAPLSDADIRALRSATSCWCPGRCSRAAMRSTRI